VRDVRFIAVAVALYGFANGLLLNATPQAVLSLKLSSAQLGMIATGVPVGYTLSCLIAGRVLSGVRAKYVIIAGTLVAIAGQLAMSQARSPVVCVIAQLSCGTAGGLFWPFASSWMLDFQSADVSKARILRHYNVAWTSATSCGMFSSGMLCQRGYIFETLELAAAVVALSMLTVLIFPKSTAHATPKPDQPGAKPASRLGLALLIAAVMANFVALGTRAVLWNNYAELNAFYHFGAERMGFITALSLGGQVTAFLLGHFYEPWLGLRRMYVVIAIVLIGANLVFAFSEYLPLILAATFMLGLTLALAFQTAIFAAIQFFSSPRAGTTFHEACIGVGSMMPLMAGQLVAFLKTKGVEPIESLRAPFLCLIALILAFLAVQMVLVGRRLAQRALFTPVPSAVVHPET